jgi:hypothetical protein
MLGGVKYILKCTITTKIADQITVVIPAKLVPYLIRERKSIRHKACISGPPAEEWIVESSPTMTKM